MINQEELPRGENWACMKKEKKSMGHKGGQE